jgi:hypothetical protein
VAALASAVPAQAEEEEPLVASILDSGRTQVEAAAVTEDRQAIPIAPSPAPGVAGEAEVASADDASAGEGEATDAPVLLVDASPAVDGPGLRTLALAIEAPAPAPHLDMGSTARYGPEIEWWADPPDRTPPAWLELKGFGVLTAAGVATLGVLTLLPEEVSNWKQEDDVWATVQSNLERAWTQPPVWDEDGWGVNYIGHPLAGMYTYLTVRNMGASRGRSFLFSSVASIGWEYVFEAWAEQPSIQDLLVTSTVGSMLGEAVFQFTRYLLRGGLRTWEKVVLTVVNPVYVIEHGYR